jgi:DNA-binding NarL/FixJ family response regulator
MKTSILLADDHTLVRQGIREILHREPDFEIVAEAGSGTEAVALAQRHKPDVAIIDIGMKELNGIEATAQILKSRPQTVVIILSMHSDERYVTRAVRAGALGYVLKNAASDELMKAIRSAERGVLYLGPVVSGVFEQTAEYAGGLRPVEDRYDLLTERERHIYQLLAEGNCNKDVANRLNLSVHTVETHRARIMEKLGVHTAAELVLSAVRRGVVV